MTPVHTAEPTTSVPTPIGPEAAVPPRAPTLDQLADELVELEGHFPVPHKQDMLADCRWIQERWGTAVFAPFRGTHVAVFNGEIVGSGDNSLPLELDLARKLGVHPQRLVIVYIDPGLLTPVGGPGRLGGT